MILQMHSIDALIEHAPPIRFRLVPPPSFALGLVPGAPFLPPVHDLSRLQGDLVSNARNLPDKSFNSFIPALDAEVAQRQTILVISVLTCLLPTAVVADLLGISHSQCGRRSTAGKGGGRRGQPVCKRQMASHSGRAGFNAQYDITQGPADNAVESRIVMFSDQAELLPPSSHTTGSTVPYQCGSYSVIDMKIPRFPVTLTGATYLAGTANALS